MASPTTVRQLREALEERRRNTLGLLKALDRLGVSPTQLPAPTMQDFAERDADCVGWLLRLAEMEPRTPADSHVAEVQSLAHHLNELESRIVDAVPARLRERLRMAQDVGASIVDRDEIYEGHRPRRCRAPRPR
jgi:hypothetical protein